MTCRVLATCMALALLACSEKSSGGNDQNFAGTTAGTVSGAGTTAAAGTAPVGGMAAGTGQVGGIGGMGVAGTGASGTGASGTGVAGIGVSGTGASGTGASGTGAAGTTAGTGAAGTTAGTGAAGTGAAGTTAGTGAAGTTAGTGGMLDVGCTPAPSDSFDTMTVTNTGPDGNYTIFRPSTLGENGFVHPPVAWGNGLGTRPSQYTALLSAVASNGFVVIANPGTGSDPQVVRQGLDWLIDQNGSGEYAGMLAVDCAGNIGYSMGGGAAVDSAAEPVKAVVAIHGIPGNKSGSAAGPILLITSTGDDFVTISGFVMPVYNASDTQPTFMAIHTPQAELATFGDHTHPIGDGGIDQEPTIAWLRYWLYGDASQMDWFFGASCKLCGMDPWMTPNKKNYTWE